jgi:hypothetical protein
MDGIPMWRPELRRVYILNNPLNIRENLHYRVCRNGQCQLQTMRKPLVRSSSYVLMLKPVPPKTRTAPPAKH